MIRALIPLLIFLGLGALFAVGLTKDPSKLPSELINQAVPAFSLTELHDADKEIDETAFMGRVSVLNVFGSWCTACLVEHPVLMRAAAREEALIIGMDWRDRREDGQAWLEQHGNPYSQIIFDEASEMAIKLGVTGAPESFIIDKSGHIRYKHTGIITAQDWQQRLRPLIERLKAE